MLRNGPSLLMGAIILDKLASTICGALLLYGDGHTFRRCIEDAQVSERMAGLSSDGAYSTRRLRTLL